MKNTGLKIPTSAQVLAELGKEALIKLCALTSGWENAKISKHGCTLAAPGEYQETHHDLEVIMIDLKRLPGW